MAKCSLIERKHSNPSAPTVFVGVKIVRQTNLRFFILFWSIWIWFFQFSIDVIFCAIAILFVSYWGPMEATFLSWILSNGLNCARELRASNLKHKDYCSHLLQTWFVEGNVVRQLGIMVYFLKSFWLAIWGGRKLETFADNVERQWWKSYRRIFAKIVAIRSPPCFFKIWVVIYRQKFPKKRL